MSNNATVIDTPDKIARFALVSLRGALRLEALGMKKKGQSALSIARAKGFRGSRKAIIAALDAELSLAPIAHPYADNVRLICSNTLAHRESEWAHNVLTGGETGA